MEAILFLDILSKSSSILCRYQRAKENIQIIQVQNKMMQPANNVCIYMKKTHKTYKIIISRKFGNKRNWETSCYRNKLRLNNQPYEVQ